MQGIKYCPVQVCKHFSNITSAKILTHVVVVKCQPCLLHCFSQTSNLPFSGSVPSLMSETLCEANKTVTNLARETNETHPAHNCAKETYTSYSAEDCAHIGKNAAKHGPRHVCTSSPRINCVSAEETVLGRINDWPRKM